MINTPADARAYVSFAKFPPIGERSWGPHRATTLANMPDQKVYLREANDLTVTFAMIETRTALDNIEAIAATPGIDALFLGPADLSIALSNGANVDPMSGEVDRELDRITAAATKAGKCDGRLLPLGRARRCARQARGALPRRQQRHGLPAGGCRGGAESAEELTPGFASFSPACASPAPTGRALAADRPRPRSRRRRARDSRARSATPAARYAPWP